MPLRTRTAIVAAALVALWATEASATREGVPLGQIHKALRLLGSYSNTGGSLTSWTYAPDGNGVYNYLLLDSSTASIESIPTDGVVEKAFLFWSGSTLFNGSPTVDFTIPDRTTFPRLTGTCSQINTSEKGQFFYCRRDVTDLIKGHAPVNGAYVVSSLEARISATCEEDPWCQARYAGWSVVIVWSAQSRTKYRDIVLYDGFYHVDEDSSSGVSQSMPITDFTVGSPAYAELSFFGLEGDAQLGEPYQGQLPSTNPLYCQTCNDYLSLNGTRLHNSRLHPDANNVFNSTIEGASTDVNTGVGIDIGTFNVGEGGLNILQSGQTSATIVVGAGDGIVGDKQSLAGGGESIFLGYVVLALDTLAPDFRRSGTYKDVDKTSAWSGDTLTYTIVVKNEGSLTATNVMVLDPIPANSTYVAGSTTLDGVAVPDARGGQCPVAVAGGLNVGSISVGQMKKVKFTVKVTPARPSVKEIVNAAQITPAETQPVMTNQVKTTVNSGASGIKTVSKTVVDLNGGFVEPGDALQYELTMKNESDADVYDLKLEDDVPAHTAITKVNAPSGAVDRSTTSRVLIEGISIPRRFQVSFTFLVKIDSADKWPDQSKINGWQLSNQGKLSGASLQGTLLTDDPAKPGATDPTVATMTWGPDFSGSTKTVIDRTSAPPAPGDLLEYTITMKNSGNRQVPVILTDTLSAYVDSATFTLISIPAGARSSFAAGTFTLDGFDLPGGGATAQIKYSVKLAGLLPAGTTEVKNSALVLTPADGAVSKALSASVFVTQNPDFSTTTKAAFFGGDGTRRTITPGEPVRYVLTVVNSGNRLAEAAYVLDQVDTAHLDSITPENSGVFDRAQRIIRWNLGDMPIGDRRVLAFTAKAKTPLDNGLKIPNQALVFSKEFTAGVQSDDPATALADDPVTLTVRFPYDFAGSAKKVQGDTGGVVKAGDLLTYTVTAANASPGGLPGVLVIDTVDRGLTDVTVQGGTYNAITRSINWSVPRIDFGASVPLTFTARVLPPTRPGTVIENVATVTGGGVSVQTNTVRLTVAEQPGFTTSTKVATPDGVYQNRVHRARAGAPIVYLVDVTNTGTVAATGVTVIDNPDIANLVNIAPQDGGVLAGNVVTWHVPAVGVGETKTLRINAVVKTPLRNGTTIANQASVTCAENPYPALTDDPDTAPVDDATVVTVDSAPDFTGSKKLALVGGAPAAALRPGDTVTFEVTLLNTGNAVATNLLAADDVDVSRLTVETPIIGGTFDGKRVTWSLPSLGTGAAASQKVSFSAVVKQCIAGEVVNVVHIAADEVPAGYDTPKLTLPVNGGSAGGTFEKTVSFAIAPVRPGDTVTYALAYNGKDPVVLCDTTVTDAVDRNIVEVTNVSAGGLWDSVARTITWSQPGKAASLRHGFSARLKKPLTNGTEIANQAVLTAKNLAAPIRSDDPATGAPADPTKFKVTSTAGIRAVKQADRQTAAPGGTVLYTIGLANIGDAIGEGASLTDDISSFASLVASVMPLDGGAYDPAAHLLRWTPSPIDLFPPNAYTYRFSVKLKDGIPDGTQIVNQAVVKGSNFLDAFSDADNDPLNGTQPTVVTVVNKPAFTTSTKLPYSASGTPLAIDREVLPGEQLVYRIKVKNTGTIDATDVAVADRVDAVGLKNVTPGTGGAFDGVTVRWDQRGFPALKLMKPGDSVELSFAATVAAGAPPGAKISNQAEATSAEGVKDLTDDPRTAVPSDPTVVVVKAAALDADLSQSAKAAAPLRSPLRAGDLVRFTITVKNTGKGDARGATVTDQLDPTALRYVPGSTTLNGSPVGDDAGKPPFDQGLKVASTRFGSNPGADAGRVVPWDGAQPDDETAVIAFEASVQPGAKTVVNRARVDRDGGQPVWLESVTPVGEQPYIVGVTKTWLLKTDANGNGVADQGDVVSFTIAFENAGAGASKGLTLRDPISDKAVYLPASMLLTRGRGGPGTLTDVRDSDEGTFERYDGSHGTVVLQLAELPPGRRLRFSFDAVVDGCGGFSNQASITYEGGTVLTDADGDSGNGAQETIVPTCGGEQVFLSAAKEGADVNGGWLASGDQVLYTISLLNQGSADLEGVTLEDDVPAHATFTLDQRNYVVPVGATVEFLKPPTGRYARGRVVVAKLKVPRAGSPADAVKVSFTFTVDPAAKKGDQLVNQAAVYSPKVPVQKTNAVSLVVGGAAGTGAIEGRVFQKLDRDEGHMTEGKDLPLRAYTVLLEPATVRARAAAKAATPAGGAKGASVIAGDDGVFALRNVSPGRYSLTAVSGNGVPFAKVDAFDLKEGEVKAIDLPVVPAGVVYDADSGAPIDGAVVTILPDAAGATLPSMKVAKELRVQRTDWTGMYAAGFPIGGTYRVEVSTPSPTMIFPSAKYAPADGYAKTSNDGYVSTDLAADSRGAAYYLRVNADTAAATIKNNRIPIDKASGVFGIAKTSSRREATRGDIVAYTITVANTSARSFTYTGSAVGGISIRDYLPTGLRYVPGTGRLYRLADGKERPAGEVEPRGAVELTFGGLSIGARETIRLRYEAVVDLEARPGTLYNRARLFIEGHAVGNDAAAAVRVVEDPIFDQGLLIGKVFCDANRNGVQDNGEEGLGGARVYLDTGWYADVDETGKYHFKGIPAGFHLVKLDVNTLPPGSLPVNESVQGIAFTAGLPAKANFAVDCRLKRYSAWHLQPEATAGETPVAAQKPKEPDEWSPFGADVGPGDAGQGDAGPVDASVAIATTPDAGTRDGGTDGSAAANAAVAVETKPDPGAPDRSLETWVELPPPNSVTKSDLLAMHGATAPGNTVQIGSIAVPIREDGAFFATVRLMPGRNAIIVNTTDPAGHRSRIEYTIDLDPESLFVLALAEGVAGGGDLQLDGISRATSLRFGENENTTGVLLHGKALAYVKGRARGRAIFDTIEYTLHFDTSKQRELQRDYFKSVYDPEKYYPVYGDSASEVQDVVAQDKLYLLVKADESKLLIGNFVSDLRGVELFRYSRPFYGVDADLQRPVLNGNLNNRVKGFVSQGYESIMHDRLVMRPTGGSVYYLRNGGVLEGSEKIDLVVRDKDSGLEILRRTLARDLDYNVNYAGGRIILKQPISASADAGTALARPGISMTGHPVYVEIDYDYDAVLAAGGNRAWGVRVEETIMKRLRLGGGYATEQTKDRDTFRLAGGDAVLTLGKTGSFKAEIARSESFDATAAPAFFSDDGGLSFSELRPGGASGNAWLFEAQGDVGEMLKIDGKFLFLKGYAQGIDPGFSAGASVLQQGMLKYGFDAVKPIPGEMELRLKADVLNMTIPAQPMTEGLATRDLSFDRYSAYASWQKKLGPWKLLAEDNYIYFKDNIVTPEEVHTDIAGTGLSYEINRRWEVFGAQQGVIGGDEELYGQFIDRMFTTVGARYTIRDGLVASAAETARWSGDNATQVGLKVPLSQAGSAYVNERLGSWNGRFVSTSIVGAEDQSIPGTRTYGEYQVDSVSDNAMNRSVFGLNNRWPVAKGTFFNLDYEHSQVMGAGPYFTSTDTALGQIPLSSSVYTAYGRPAQNAFLASSRQSPLQGEQPGLKREETAVGQNALVPYYGLNYPLGLMEGDSVRDIFAVGVEFLRYEFFKIGGRLELRFDNADENFNGQDRYQYLASIGSTWRWTRDLSFLTKFTLSDTLNQKFDRREARFIEASFGFALRPVQYDWINIIFKYSRLAEFRNFDLTQDDASQDTYSDILTIMPIVETPLRLQIVEKLAFKHAVEKYYGQPWAVVNMVLWINRLNFHAWRDKIDIGGEYRTLMLLDLEKRDGWLVEAAFIPAKYIRVGVGWNFSSFSDSLYTPLNHDASGFFVRMTGQY